MACNNISIKLLFLKKKTVCKPKDRLCNGDEIQSSDYVAHTSCKVNSFLVWAILKESNLHVDDGYLLTTQGCNKMKKAFTKRDFTLPKEKGNWLN